MGFMKKMALSAAVFAGTLCFAMSAHGFDVIEDYDAHDPVDRSFNMYEASPVDEAVTAYDNIDAVALASKNTPGAPSSNRHSPQKSNSRRDDNQSGGNSDNPRTNRDPVREDDLGRMRTSFGYGPSIPLMPSNFAKHWHPGLIFTWAEQYDTRQLSMGGAWDLGTFNGNKKNIAEAINKDPTSSNTVNASDLIVNPAIFLDFEVFLKYYLTPFSKMSWYASGSVGYAFIFGGVVEDKDSWIYLSIPDECLVANIGMHFSVGGGFDYAVGTSGLDLFVDARYHMIMGYGELGTTATIPIRAGVKFPISILRIMRMMRR